MLILTRKKDEKIIIGGNIEVMVIEIQGDKVRLGIAAPRDVPVDREEVHAAKKKEKETCGCDICQCYGEGTCDTIDPLFDPQEI